MSLINVNVAASKITLAECATSRAIKVLVLGCGGTGSEMVDALCRLHYSLIALGHPAGLEVTLQDHDTVSPFNVGRQRFVPSDIGLNKAEVLAKRYSLLLGMPLSYIPRRAVNSHIQEFGIFDLIVTCVDVAALRVRIAKHWQSRKTNAIWLDSGNGKSEGQVLLSHLGKPLTGDRLPNVFDLFPEIEHVVDSDQPSCSMEAALSSQMLFINRIMADVASALLVRLFTLGEVSEHGAFVNMQKLTVNPIKVDPKAWEFSAGRPIPA